ncbi:putative quinate permease [Colletotrichum higginsianum]|uniref:Putative quinate permease n=1 Tax=Colletotrichum higginsianum TaxID=80884 RepID=A0A4T0VXJ7_9PEZI|nr:putative quinate permease [Colletotrichum higginsianum]
MAGGVKKPINIFKLGDLGEPKGVFNWRLWFAVISFGLMGAARGVDEGLISGAFGSKDFQRFIHYETYSEVEQTNIKANVSAMVQLGSVAGALFAFLICDKIGRIWATRQLCIVWIIGIAIFMANNGSLAAVYAGRFIAGLGVGQTPVVAPVYLAEIAPASIRGLCTCVFTGFVYLGIVLAYFTNYGCQIHLGDNTHNRWLGKIEQATETMAHLRHLPVDHDYVTREIYNIQHAHHEELEASKGATWYGKVKELFLVPSNLYRLYLSTMVQFLSQWSGAGSITLYAPDLFKILGIEGQNESLLITAVFGVVKLTAAILCALFLVDVIGRKRALLTGITLQAIAMIYVAAFLTHVPLLGVDESFKLPDHLVGVSKGAIAMIYVSGFGWALGWNSMQYLLTAELFPLRVRALATSWAMTLHFANQYGNSRAVPNMLASTSVGGISPMGTFWSFAAITLIGGAWVWFFVPETSGRALESMDRLFELPWYRIGLYGNQDAEERDIVHNEKQEAAEAVLGEAEHAEKKSAHV